MNHTNGHTCKGCTNGHAVEDEQHKWYIPEGYVPYKERNQTLNRTFNASTNLLYIECIARASKY